MKITDKRKSHTVLALKERTQAENDAIFVNMVARLADVQAASDLLCSVYEVEV